MNIPAAASLFLLFTLFLLIFSALYSWLKGWTVTVIIITLMMVNFISNQFEGFRFRNYAYGIDYSIKNEYSWESLTKLSQDKIAYEESIRSGIAILENWKKRNQKNSPNAKPKLILVNISGGGLRASVWAMEVLQELEKETNGDFFRHSQLITGASGGMIGASYYRELYRKQLYDSSINTTSKRYIEQLSEDLLNPLAFGIATTDFLFRYQNFEDGNYTYTKDRGYSFEQKLIKNLGGTFDDKRLGDYYEDEFRGMIPMMIFSPSVVNDGRRLLISPQKISYLTFNKDTNYVGTYSSMENIEFTRLFKKNDPYNLKITSAMRMSATFPYILPMVTMPTDPPIELMDAGIRDNYGLKTSLEYLRIYKNWIKTNTSGVILVEIRDKQKSFEVLNPNNGTILQRLFAPFTSFYSNTTKTHDYTNDQLLRSVPDWYKGDFEAITFYVNQELEKPISMSWHLTSLDKEYIKNAFKESNNQKALERLKTLLDIE
jgi:predicted acylesterase/phospholipase RssA